MAQYESVGLPYPLSDLRVIDASTGIAGGYGAKLLVDAGADVVKLEAPGGDPLRRRRTRHPSEADGTGVLFDYLHRGKASVEVSADGANRAEVRALLDAADVVISDDRSDTIVGASGWEPGPAQVVTRLSPFGLRGPWSDRPASDLTLQALSSSIASRGEPDGAPVAAGGELIAWTAGSVAAVATLAALRRRSRTGRGDHLDVSELEVAITIFNGFRAVSAQLGGPPSVPARSVEVPSIEPAADGWVGFCTLSAVQFGGFAEMIGRSEWIDDPEIRSLFGRSQRAEDLRSVIAAWTGGRTVDEIVRLAAARRIPAVPVGNGQTTPHIDHLAERGALLATLDRQPRIPYRFSGQQQPPFRPSPELGQADPGEVAARWTPRRAAPTEPDGRLPLEGLRVFDLTTYWAGPYASQILAFFGAEVIKVESIQHPDGTRFSTSYGIEGDHQWERAPLFQAVNAGKQGITLDLTTPRGQDLARRLIERCDVLVENYVPRVVEQFGLLDDLPEHLIVVRMPAWGLSGPWRDRPGFAQTMEQVSGLAWLTGRPDGPPLIPRGPCDPIGGLHAAFATLVALAARDRTGQGEHIEVPLIETALSTAAEQFMEHARHGTLLERIGNRSRTAAPHGVFRCRAPEDWVAIAVTDDQQWATLCRLLGEPPWACDERLGSATGRLAAEPMLSDHLAAWCAEQSSEEITQLLWPNGVPAAPVVLPDAVVDLPPVVDRAFFEPVHHPLVGALRLPGFPVRFASRPTPFSTTAAPLLGQHNEEVLSRLLGLGSEELRALADAKVIGNHPVMGRPGVDDDARS